MKAVAPQFAAHLAGDVTMLATCWRVTRADAGTTGEAPAYDTTVGEQTTDGTAVFEAIEALSRSGVVVVVTDRTVPGPQSKTSGWWPVQHPVPARPSARSSSRARS